MVECCVHGGWILLGISCLNQVTHSHSTPTQRPAFHIRALTYMYEPSHTFASLHVHVRTFTYMYEPSHTFTSLHVHVRAFTYMYEPSHTCTSLHDHIHVRAVTYMYMCMSLHIHLQAFTYMYEPSHTGMYVCMRKHTYQPASCNAIL